jgi:hypothetical protein
MMHHGGGPISAKVRFKDQVTIRAIAPPAKSSVADLVYRLDSGQRAEQTHAVAAL